MIGKVLVIAATLVIVRAECALADSEGYYCIGPNYVAYQFGMAPPAKEPHGLYVVWFDAQGHMSETRRTVLPDFQVRGMHCKIDRIEVASFDSVYHVALREGHIGRAIATPHTAGWQAEWTDGYGNLGRWSRLTRAKPKRVIPLVATGQEMLLVLEMTARFSKDDPCSADVLTEIVQYRTGEEVESRQVYKGPLMVECGDEEVVAGEELGAFLSGSLVTLVR